MPKYGQSSAHFDLHLDRSNFGLSPLSLANCTDSVVSGSTSWETGWWARTAASPSLRPPLKRWEFHHSTLIPKRIGMVLGPKPTNQLPLPPPFLFLSFLIFSFWYMSLVSHSNSTLAHGTLQTHRFLCMNGSHHVHKISHTEMEFWRNSQTLQCGRNQRVQNQ